MKTKASAKRTSNVRAKPASNAKRNTSGTHRIGKLAKVTKRIETTVTKGMCNMFGFILQFLVLSALMYAAVNWGFRPMFPSFASAVPALGFWNCAGFTAFGIFLKAMFGKGGK